MRHLQVALVELRLQCPQPFLQLQQVHVGQLADVLIQYAKGQRFGLQAVPVTFGARHGIHKRGRPLLQAGGTLVAGQFGDIVHDALELAEVARIFGVLNAGEMVAAVEDGVDGLLAEVLEGIVEREVVVLAHEFQLAVDVVGGRVFPQHLDGAVLDALLGVGDELLHVDLRHFAEAVAMGAGAVGRVEREGVGLRLGVGEAAVGVHQHATEIAYAAVFIIQYHQDAFALTEGRLDGFAETCGISIRPQSVDHQLDVVHLVAVHLHLVGNLLYLAVDAYFQEPFLRYLLEELAVVALAPFHQRGENHDVAATVFRGNDFQYLLFAVLHHGLAADGAVGLADAGVEQTQQVVGVGQCAHRRARVVIRALLLDGDDGREALDEVHVGPLHIADEVAGIGREGLHVAALPLGMDGVESQR